MENTIGVQLGLGHVLEAEGSFRRELSNVACALLSKYIHNFQSKYLCTR